MFSRKLERLRANKRAISTLKIILIAIIVAASVLTVVTAAVLLGFWQPFGHVVGSGNLATEKRNFTDFTIVEVGWGFEVEIGQSNSYDMNITADDNIFGYIEIYQTGEKLTVGLKWGYGYQDVTVRTGIAMPNLYELRLSGGTHGSVEGFTSTHEFIVDLSGGSRLNGDFTTNEDAQFYLSGGSRLIFLGGAANNLSVGASGGSSLELTNFPVHNATVNLSGGSSAKINLDGRLDGDLSGGSNLKYAGSPTIVDVTTSGDSTVGPQ